MMESLINNDQGWGKVPNNQNVDYLGLRVNMKPSMFLKLAAPLERADASSVQDMVQHLNTGGSVASPWLVIHIPAAWEEGDYDQAARVTSHEGRNRMYAIQDVQGDVPVEVHVFFGAGLRARHIQSDWVAHMMHELIPQGQKTPQQGPWFTPISHNVAEHVVEEVKPDVHSLRIDQLEKLMRGSKGYTFDIPRRKLNVPNLIRKGVIFVTYPHDKSGWLINDQRDWSYSLITLYNMHGGGWTTQADKYKKPRSYTHAEQTINTSQPNLGNQQLVYDNKYLQILWSIKKLGLLDSQVYVEDPATVKPMAEAASDSQNMPMLYHGTLVDNLPSIKQHGLTPRVGAFTADIYGAKALPLVFAADAHQARSVYCSLVSSIFKKINHKPNLEEFLQHAVVLVIQSDKDKFERYSGKIRKGSLEPGDYYSTQPVKPDHILQGDKLHEWLMQTNADQGEICPISEHSVSEAWSKKYKKSINCANPKGFSQRAHCAGRRARQSHKSTKSKAVS
jgi:hypothetical protein